MNSDQLDAVVQSHQTDYESIGGCVCGEVYPCTTRLLVAEVRALRERVATLEGGIDDHRLNYTNPFAGWTEREANERLWSLLDASHDQEGNHEQ